MLWRVHCSGFRFDGVGTNMDMDKVFLIYGPLTGFVVILVTLVFNNHKGLFEIWLGIKTQKFVNLEEAIKSADVSEKDKAALRTELAYLHLKRATGMLGRKAVIQSLLHVYNKSEQRVRLFHFQRASPYVDITENGQLIFNMTLLTCLWKWLCILLAALGLVLFAVALFSYRSEMSLSLAFNVISLPIMSVAYFWEGISYISFRHVSSEYERQNQTLSLETIDAEAAA